VREHLDERVLDGFVGVVGVAKIVVGDPQGASRSSATTKAFTSTARCEPREAVTPRGVAPATGAVGGIAAIPDFDGLLSDSLLMVVLRRAGSHSSPPGPLYRGTGATTRAVEDHA
jgi:hypothetical protein